MAVILAGGEGERLSILSGVRAKPAVPFGGKYRIIDFTLSNCVNSDVDNVVVLTQYNPRSLNDHIGLGRPWDLDRNRGGVKMLQPYIARGRVAEWYRGTADAVLQNFNVIEHDCVGHGPRPRRRSHLQDGLPAVPRGPSPEARRRHDRRPPRAPLRREPDGRPRPRRQRSGHRVAGEAEAAEERPRLDGRLRVLEEGAPALARRRPDRLRAARDPGDARRRAARVFGYRYEGYWQDVGTIQSYWEANLALLQDNAELDLYDKEWVIHTRSEERAPAKVGPTAQVHRSLISPRLHDQRHRRQLRPVARRPGRRRRGRPRLDRDVRLRDPVRRGRRPIDPRQGGRRRPGRDRRRRARLRHAEPAGARPAEHRASPWSGSGRSSRAGRGSVGTSRSPATSGRPTSGRRS